MNNVAEYETVIVERTGRVAVVTLNRPKALNALNTQVMNDVTAAVSELDGDRSVGAIIITGSEKAFAAGADIKEMSQLGFEDVYEQQFFAGWEALTRARTPIIAAVAGFALGGGCELAMMCDMIVAADSARFGQPEITLGVIPGMGGSQRLTRAVGKAKAMDMCLTGRHMKADEAERAGLVARVVPADELQQTAREVAATIAGMAKTTATMAKDAVNAAFETPLAEGLKTEKRIFYSTFATDDQTEGMAAFIDKREPQFKR